MGRGRIIAGLGEPRRSFTMGATFRHGTTMFSLLKIFWEIAVFRRAPQDLPASVLLLRFSVMFYVLVGLTAVLLPLPTVSVVVIALLDTIFLGVAVAGGLMLRGFSERVVQALCAVYGTLGLIGLLMLPITAWVLNADAQGGTVLMAAVAFWLLYLWSIAALGHILRHAFSIPLLAAVVISYAYFLIWQQLAPLLMGSQ